MTDNALKAKCSQLLARRHVRGSLWYYARSDWRRQFLYGAAYVVIVTALWHFGHHLVSSALAGFFVGRTVRDVRWWYALANEWPTTCQVIDWAKVERQAGP